MVEHEYSTARGPAFRERHDIVYREMPGQAPAATPASPASEPPAERSWRVESSPVLLFRYSALTFNGHRIHYDQPYVTGVEGYPGLVVHGPLQATLLLNLAAALGAPVFLPLPLSRSLGPHRRPGFRCPWPRGRRQDRRLDPRRRRYRCMEAETSW